MTQNDKIQETIEEVTKFLKAQNKATRKLLTLNSERLFSIYYFNEFIFPHHQLIYNHINQYKRSLILAPRDHGKSRQIALKIPIMEICKDRNYKIVIVSQTSTKANDVGQAIRYTLESNEKLIEDFGEFKNKNRTWQSTKLIVNGRDDTIIDPTLTSFGREADRTGLHPDLLIFDDIISDTDGLTEVARQKIITKVYTTFFPFLHHKTGRFIGVGTIKRFDDIYHTLIKDPTIYTLVLKSISDSEILDDKSYYDVIYDEKEPDKIKKINLKKPVKTLWQYRWPPEELILRYISTKANGNPRLFFQEYQNEVKASENAIFKKTWLDSSLNSYISYRKNLKDILYSKIIQAWDFAYVDDKGRALKTNSDYTVGLTIGLDRQGNRYLIDMVRERGITYEEIKKHIINQYNMHKPSVVIMEKNSAQSYTVQEMRSQTDMPIFAHYTSRNKKEDLLLGVHTLANMFENGKYNLPYLTDDDKFTTDIIYNELFEYPDGSHDDIVMTMWFIDYYLRQNTSLNTNNLIIHNVKVEKNSKYPKLFK